MKEGKRYNEITLEIDLQLLASEMDSKVKDLLFFSDYFCEDSEDIEAFNSMWAALKELMPESSFDDDTEIYEVEEIIVVTHETLTEKYIICENKDLHKIKLVLAVI